MEAIQEAHVVYRDISDEMLVEQILLGKKELFDLLMKRYNQRLFRVIRSYLKTEDEVTDIMQETYLKAYMHLAQFRGDASFSTWLIRIGINEALIYLRKAKRRWSFFGERKKEQNAEQSLSVIDTMSPERKTIQHENRRMLEAAIDHLPEKYRIVYMLREIEGLSSMDTAVALGLSEANVKVRLHRAKEALQKSLLAVTAGTGVFEFGNCKCDRLREAVMQKIYSL